MELSKQIKKIRMLMTLSQEELAEKIFVSRQTISNWETDKNCPDLQSLLLLSELFEISLDELIKGDVEMMKEKINMQEVNQLIKYGNVYGLMLIFCIIFIPVSIYYLKTIGLFISIIFFLVTIVYAVKVEKIKRANNVQTYKEILAFMNGETLDPQKKQIEIGKRTYQKVLMALGGGLVAAFIVFLVFKFIALI
ncbi:MAG: helix-turn-helix transcriptional regulator [Clostridia bacterium]|nr:helix-turn-helix transcriptional regulator [Clostridia bacterium]